ncbi:cysteine peptidase family C39 domain-containing protein [Leuconostoc suionicum]|uniref:cysteine peptidase family C39 domain-containing protein n=1 Tax=Leuconostoc suionicum TaxID=1511761 RepID=UPI0032DE574C
MKKIDEDSKVSLALGIAVVFALGFLTFAFSGRASADTVVSKYQVGNVVRITNNAWSETNGYTLTNRHNWYGTVVSKTPKKYSNSSWQYKIVYPNGWHNDYVAEQDITTIPNSKFSVGSVARITSNAWSETNGYTLTNRHNWAGTIVSVRAKPYSISAWEYKIVYPNGWHSDYVAEQDLTNIPNARYNVGNTVKIAGNAWSETNGYTLRNRQNWVGTVVSATPKPYSNSAWVYKIQYPNGWHSDYVAEQDVTNISNARYKVGDTVKIASNAWSETNGYSLVNHQNWIGTVVSATPKAHSNSAWQYYIRYSNGQHNDYVAEQDLSASNSNTSTNSSSAKQPTYFSQLDSRWSGVKFRHTTIGSDGCVPTSLAMVLKGSYGLNVDPVSVAQKMAPMNSWYAGASGQDLVKTAKAYGRSVEEISDKNRAIAVLKSGVPLIMYVNVGIGHAVAVYGYNNGQVNTYDPYNWKFYGSVSSFDALWNNPSVDYNMDWDAGRPVFAIR